MFYYQYINVKNKYYINYINNIYIVISINQFINLLISVSNGGGSSDVE